MYNLQFKWADIYFHLMGRQQGVPNNKTVQRGSRKKERVRVHYKMGMSMFEQM